MASRELRTIAHALVLVAVMLGLIAAALWLRDDPSLTRPAVGATRRVTTEHPGIPDSGRQRQVIIEELRKLNARLQAIDEALRKGDYQVQTRPVEGAGAGAPEEGAK